MVRRGPNRDGFFKAFTMPDAVARLWGVCLYVAFQAARIVSSIVKPRIRGTMVAIWCRGRILLVKCSYRRGWSIPGGLVKKGETWTQAAVRETFEEVGLRLMEEDLVFKAEVPGDLGPRDLSHLFEIPLDQPGDVTVDGREIIDAEFVTPQAALKRRLHANVRRYLQERVG
jgi:ADP-ribose pyrophosphatase YjhB (NUDIX family)